MHCGELAHREASLFENRPDLIGSTVLVVDVLLCVGRECSDVVQVSGGKQDIVVDRGVIAIRERSRERIVAL